MRPAPQQGQPRLVIPHAPCRLLLEAALRYIRWVRDNDVDACTREDAVGPKHIAERERDAGGSARRQETRVYIVAAVCLREVDSGGGNVNAGADRGDVCSGEERMEVQRDAAGAGAEVKNAERAGKEGGVREELREEVGCEVLGFWAGLVSWCWAGRQKWCTVGLVRSCGRGSRDHRRAGCRGCIGGARRAHAAHKARRGVV